MGRIKDLLLDVNYMKDYAKSAARVITIDVSRFGMTDEQRLQDAAMARYQLDQLLFSEQSRIDKWAQFMVHDFDTNSIIFRGTEKECNEFINESKQNVELYWALPEDQHFNWTRYFNEVRERCNLEIEFLW